MRKTFSDSEVMPVQQRRDLNILVVEDNELDAERLSRHLRRDTKVAWTVTWVRDLAEAEAVLDESQFDAVLLDLSLPDAIGFEALTTLIDANPHCPVVVQSGIEDNSVAAEAIVNGAQDFLAKSNITASSLARSVNHAMTRYRLQATHAALMASNIELDDFAHVVAHDLRAPVRTARLLANRLMANVEPNNSESSVDVEALDLSSRLDAVLKRLDSMVLGMLEYSGLRAVSPELEPVCLYDALAAAFADLQADGEAVSLTYSIDVDPDITVRANRVMLQRVLVNLFANSVKFAKPSVPLKITASITDHQEIIRLRIKDNGVGIPSGAHEQIFELTERLDHGAAGLGFGLAICRRCMGKMDGTIYFDPTVQDGAPAVLTMAAIKPKEAHNPTLKARSIGIFSRH